MGVDGPAYGFPVSETYPRTRETPTCPTSQTLAASSSKRAAKSIRFPRRTATAAPGIGEPIPVRFEPENRALIQAYADKYTNGVFAAAVRQLADRGLAAGAGVIINPADRGKLRKSFGQMPYGGTAQIVPLKFDGEDPFATVDDVVDALDRLADYLRLVSKGEEAKDAELTHLRGLLRGGGALLNAMLGAAPRTATPAEREV